MKTDILIPDQFKKIWTDRLLPALDVFGISNSSSLESVLGDLSRAQIWPLSIRRPKPGSVILAKRNGRILKHGDLQVHLDNRDWKVEELFVRVNSVYGLTIQAEPVESKMKEVIDLEEYKFLVISTDFITLVADILPGRDAFVVVEMWANVMLPLFVLTQQNHSYEANFPLNGFGWIKDGQVEFRVTCSNCHGDGEIDCKRCDGEGTWQPDGVCKRCSGSGEIECRRCKGSGDYIGKYGDRMGDCNTCGGTGELTCRNCKGSGEPPILSCNACDRSGRHECKKCHGVGSIHAPFRPQFGNYGFRNELFAPCEITGWDARKNEDYSLDQGARSMLNFLSDDYGLHVGRKEKVRQAQNEISKLSGCLDRSMDAEGVSEELLKFRPLPLGIPQSTTERIKGCVVLAFPLLKLPRWASSGDCPLSQGTPVKFVGPDGRSEIELPRISGKTTKKLKTSSFVRMKSLEGQWHFLISMPTDIDLSKLPGDLFVAPDVLPPSELAQKKELARWCSPDRAPALLESIAIDSNEFLEPPQVVTDNAWINPSQQGALNWVMSGAPLILVKGPPGTGKTTVITEAVRQSIERNEKVLICSETHQAVENVLERLHDDGNISMIRHGRADQRQLSELGKEYLEDGAKLKFSQKVLERLSNQISNRESEVLTLEPLLSLIGAAQEASSELKASREKLLVREKEAHKKNDSELQAFQTREDEVCRDAKEKADVEDYKLTTREKGVRHSLNKKKIKIMNLRTDRDEARRSFLKKTGQEPDPNYRGSASMFRKLSSFGINSLASPEHINEKFVKAGSMLQNLEGEVSQLEEEADSIQREIEQNHRDRDRYLAMARHQKEESVKSSQHTLEKELEAISLDFLEAESLFIPAQKVAAESAASTELFKSWSIDALPEVWEARARDCSTRIERRQEELKFSKSWQNAASSTSSALSSLFWDTAQVFLSTCVGLASWRSFTKQFGESGVDLVIIDEAAHATLTQSLIPMGRARRAVLIGDEMQLPPAAPMGMRERCENSCDACSTSLDSNVCLEQNSFKPEMSSCWLERSAFEWIVETRPWIPKVMLNEQFRMHPDIADFVAQVFYPSGLKNGAGTSEKILNFGPFNKAVCLVSTSAYKDRFEDLAPGSTSYRNSLESHLTKRILLEAQRGLETDASFGVLTPYSAQKDMMLKDLEEFFDGGKHLKIGSEDIASVDSFQGSERDVMIASFVRSPKRQPKKCKTCNGTGKYQGGDCSECDGSGWKGAKLKWVQDLRRLNVAFSRARKMLILVGDIEALTDRKIGTEKGTAVLSRFKDYISDRGRVLHVWEEESCE